MRPSKDYCPWVLTAAYSAANPAYTAGELEYQLTATKAKLILIHPWSLSVGLAAARAAGISSDRVVLFNVPQDPDPAAASYPTVNDLVVEGKAKTTCFVERRLRPGEGKTKLAFLSFSSGTTGKPKARCPLAHSVALYVKRNSRQFAFRTMHPSRT